MQTVVLHHDIDEETTDLEPDLDEASSNTELNLSLPELTIIIACRLLLGASGMKHFSDASYTCCIQQ